MLSSDALTPINIKDYAIKYQNNLKENRLLFEQLNEKVEIYREVLLKNDPATVFKIILMLQSSISVEAELSTNPASHLELLGVMILQSIILAFVASNRIELKPQANQ